MKIIDILSEDPRMPSSRDAFDRMMSARTPATYGDEFSAGPGATYRVEFDAPPGANYGDEFDAPPRAYGDEFDSPRGARRADGPSSKTKKLLDKLGNLVTGMVAIAGQHYQWMNPGKGRRRARGDRDASGFDQGRSTTTPPRRRSQGSQRYDAFNVPMYKEVRANKDWDITLKQMSPQDKLDAVATTFALRSKLSIEAAIELRRLAHYKVEELSKYIKNPQDDIVLQGILIAFHQNDDVEKLKKLYALINKKGFLDDMASNWPEVKYYVDPDRKRNTGWVNATVEIGDDVDTFGNNFNEWYKSLNLEDKLKVIVNPDTYKEFFGADHDEEKIGKTF